MADVEQQGQQQGPPALQRSHVVQRSMPPAQRVAPVEVVRVQELTPSMRRLTLAGPGLADYPVRGGDHHARLLLPRPGQPLVLPTSDRWWPELLAAEPAGRPVVRAYTFSGVRPAQAEVDLDVVLHDHGGPGATWCAAAAVGDPAGLVDQGVDLTLDPDLADLLLVADETGLPAARGLLAELPDGARATVVLEVAGAADVQELPHPERTDVTWLHRGSGPAGEAALAHVRSLPPRGGAGHAWLAGEAAMVTRARRHLVSAGGYDKGDVTFGSYWRVGRAQYADDARR